MKTKKLFFWALMASVIAIISVATFVGCNNNEDTHPPESPPPPPEPPSDVLAKTCWQAADGNVLSFANNGTAIMDGSSTPTIMA
jgi:hypothetical protein